MVPPAPPSVRADCDCESGACDASGKCFECQNDQFCQLSTRYLPICEKGSCVACRRNADCPAGRHCDSRNACALDATSPVPPAVCGDGVLADTEECEIGVGGLAPHVWDASNCKGCKSIYWQPCTAQTASSCPREAACLTNVRINFCVPRACASGLSAADCEAFRNRTPALRACPSIPSATVINQGDQCFISCLGKCPLGLECSAGVCVPPGTLR